MLAVFKKDYIYNLNNNWKFEYSIVILYILLGIFGWNFNYLGFGIISLVLSMCLLLIFNDFNYMIPSIFMVIFSYNGGYSTGSIPFEIIGYAVSIVFLVILYTIYNFKKSNFKRLKSYVGILLLSISCFLPIFWNASITEDTRLLYFMYFAWIIYLVLYFVIGINIGKNSLRMLIFTMSSLPILLCVECAYNVIYIFVTNPNFEPSELWYYLGWGLCNEAGIICCMCMPFIFYEYIKSKKLYCYFLAVFKLAMCIVCIVLTASRASMLFGGIEAVALMILSLILGENKKIGSLIMVSIIIIGCILFQILFGFDRLIDIIVNKVFYEGFTFEGRKDIWRIGIASWKRNPLTIMYGSGIISDFQVRESFHGVENIYLVYHSTFFETLVMGGIVGIGCLIFHFVEKYKQLLKCDKTFLLIMLVGYLLVDGYGMLDNSYGMYYYMVPLITIMATLDVDTDTNLYENRIYSEKDLGGSYEIFWN